MQAARAGGRAAVRLMMLALLPVVGLFLAYEVIERTWLSGAAVEFLHVLHRVRGAAAAVIAAGVASWLLLREAPPLLLEAHDPNGRPHDSAGERVRKSLHYARWFIVMRWIAVIVAALVTFTAVEVLRVLPSPVGPRLGGVIVGLAVLNLGYTLYLRRARAGTGFLAVQTYADVAALILLLHFSGGIENPLTPLLLLHVIIAGIVLGRAHCYAVAGAASILFALMALGEWSGLLAHYPISAFSSIHADGQAVPAAQDLLHVGSRTGLQAAIMGLVAYFTTTLVARIRDDERSLAVLADRAQAQAQLLERALDTTGTALCVCDRDRRGSWRNRRWEEWTGVTPGLGCCVPDDGSPADLTLADGKLRVDEVRLASRAGEPGAPCLVPGRVLRLTTAPLHDRDGRISHVVTLARDVTAEEDARLRVIRAERLAAVGELAGQVAHEVNNPIAVISAKARLLLRDERNRLPPRAAEEVGKIVQLADRIARIAQGLLSYCRPSAGVRRLLDVRVPIRQALTYVEPRAARAAVRIRDELPAAMPQVWANAAELEQVFHNLFINALDAMPQGGELRVTGCSSAGREADEPGWLEVVVEDTGSGIAPPIRERIFEPFLTTKPEGQGSGLGLSICLGLVRSHGGRIAVESEADHPTRVRVELPVGLSRSEPAVPDARQSWQEAFTHV